MAGDTITAIATPLAAGGLGVLRISGSEACPIADSVFKAKRHASVSEIGPYSAAFGHVYSDGTPLDECIALVFRAPHSYTGEDVVELSCHGGVYILKKLLEAVVSAGARLAEPGEFTRRAFLNGRIDLTQAEAVMQLVSARSRQAASAALAQHEGALFRRIQSIRGVLLNISSDICAYVDFPDEDIPSLEHHTLEAAITDILEKLNECIDTAETGRILREGIDTVIVGKANVGKSTLMNRLSGREKSIVTEFPGTTRDVVEESVSFAGCLLNLADTAGLREAADPAEQIGVRRARERLETAQLIFAVFDASEPLDNEDLNLLGQLSGRPTQNLFNKCDLGVKADLKILKGKPGILISAATGEGIDELEKAVKESLQIRDIDPGAGILANERQVACVLSAKDGIQAALKALEEGMTIDAVSTGIEQAMAALDRLTGKRAADEVLDLVFQKFCVGK